MLNKLDDFPIHQTAEPIAHPASSDRNVYDRTWFNGYAEDGSYYFGIGMSLFPHRGILDCALSVVEKDGRQHSFFGSRRAPLERTEMQVGPFRMEVLEPLRRTRVTLDDNGSGIRCDLRFSARTAAMEEDRQTMWQGTRRTMDTTRFLQFGRWTGSIRHPDGEIDLSASQCHATKDRSWGTRDTAGEPESGGAPTSPSGVFFIWAPLIWDDHVSHAVCIEDEHGRPLINEAIVAPLYESEAAVPEVVDSRYERLDRMRQRVSYHPGTRLAKSAEIDLIDFQDRVRTVSLEPMLRFQMKGLGYFHPEWGQGFWKGELATGSDSFDPDELDLLAPENIHVQQVVRASDDERSGIGVLEQTVFGPYAPAGFTGFVDVPKR